MRHPEASALLRWYDQRRRDLPWRRSRDPYSVWVSEIMLQQTRVATALPYYAAFLDRFPSVDDLAAAEIDEVLALWSGLGYYRRARQMHAAAVVVSRPEDGTRSPGVFPHTAEGLRKLPGIGPYTAAAIASICFDEVIPVMDGNVERVLARRLALCEDVKRSAPRGHLLAAAAEWLDAARPGDSNQALMELGATVCTPRSPRCDECPLQVGCLGRRDPENYPAPRAKKAQVKEARGVAVVRRRDGAVLLLRRPSDEEMMAGLWELPQTVIPAGASAAQIAAALSHRYGGAWDLAAEACRVRHTITHRLITLCVHPAKLREAGDVAEAAGSAEAAWVLWHEDAERYATSSMVGKILGALSGLPTRSGLPEKGLA